MGLQSNGDLIDTEKFRSEHSVDTTHTWGYITRYPHMYSII